MKFRFTLLSMVALLFASCADQEEHEIALDRGYEPFSTVMQLSKTMVQEVLVAAYSNPELISFDGEDVATNRNDCPDQKDNNPDIFPKTLTFAYELGCLTDSNNDIDGDLDVYVSDRIGVRDMEIILVPQDNFSINGNQIGLKGADAIFRATFKGNDVFGLDSYALDISGLTVETPELRNFEILNMPQGEINFRDVDGNNGDAIGPLAYIDDLAIINFGIMSYTNNVGEKLSVTVDQEMSFDLFCACPLGGRVEVRSEDNRKQIIDYNSNSNCGGKIIIDAAEVACN